MKGFVSTNAHIRTQNGHQTSQHHPTGSRVRAKGNKQLSHLLTYILPPATYWPRRKLDLFQRNGSVFSLCHGCMPSAVLCNSARIFVLTDVQPTLHCFTASFGAALQVRARFHPLNISSKSVTYCWISQYQTHCKIPWKITLYHF